MKIKTQATFELPDDILESLLTTGLEGGNYGIGYWFCASDLSRDQDRLIYHAIGVDAEIPSACENWSEVSEQHKNEHGDIWKLTKETVEKGLKKAIRENHKSVMDALRSESPECQLDAEDADIIIQYGLFGKIVYG